jgi:hypothetical protein
MAQSLAGAQVSNHRRPRPFNAVSQSFRPRLKGNSRGASGTMHGDNAIADRPLAAAWIPLRRGRHI